MATQGPNNGGTFADDAGSGSQTWTSPGDAVSSNNVYSVVAASGTWDSHLLKVTNFGFSIPAGANIDGILAEVEAGIYTGVGVKLGPSSCRIYKAGATTGSGPSGADISLTSTDTYYSIGSGSDLWGATLTASDINDSGFGVGIVGRGTDAGLAGVRIDHIRVTVTYTLPPERVTNETTQLPPRARPRRGVALNRDDPVALTIITAEDNLQLMGATVQ